jgi:hypothetical protein
VDGGVDLQYFSLLFLSLSTASRILVVQFTDLLTRDVKLGTFCK